MKSLIFTLFFLTTASQADVIRCSFTEPFLSTTYSMAQQTLLMVSDVDQTQQLTRNVSFQIRGAGKFQLVAKNGKVLQTLILDMDGSDGMSGRVFPYSVEYQFGATRLFGGCSSNYMASKDE